MHIYVYTLVFILTSLCLALLTLFTEPARVKFTRVAAVLRSKADDLGAPGDDPSTCITSCMSRRKLPAMNRQHCFCLNAGDVQLHETFPEGDDVLTVMEITRYMPKSYGE